MVPIYEQLMEQIKSDIIQSELKEGEALPAVTLQRWNPSARIWKASVFSMRY